MTGILVLLGGGALVAISGWSWAGRTPAARWWVRRWEAAPLALGIVPGIGLLLFGLGLYAVGPAPLQVIGGLLWLASFPVLLVGFLTPRWWGPGWYRAMTPQQRREAMRDPIGMMVAAASAPAAVSSRAEASSSSVGSSPVVDHWRAGWVRDPDSDQRTHALSRRGSVDGTLSLHRDGLVFAATAREDALRREPTIVVVDAGAVRCVRTIAARAGADGAPRPGVRHRSLFPRLLVETDRESQVYEVAFGRAPRAAAVIEATLKGRTR
ncbi:MAG: hypothetical protein ACR2KL_01390 [Nocardioidaceae bacterium]